MKETNPAKFNKNIFETKRREIYWQLKEIGLEEQECQAEAMLIVERVSGMKQTEQVVSDLDEFPLKWQDEIKRIINLRAERRPLAYGLGEVEFAGLSYRIIPGVLIPRPDTETLVEAVIEWIKKYYARATIAQPNDTDRRNDGDNDGRKQEKNKIGTPALSIAEIGVGSGNIAVSLLTRLPNCTVWACDISEAAIATALGNARRHGVDKRLTLVHGDWRRTLPNNFDIIVSNPPYVSTKELLQPEIYFEPKDALFAGEDGLDFYRDFARLLPKHFKHNDQRDNQYNNQSSKLASKNPKKKDNQKPYLVAFEIGDSQAEDVSNIFKNTGWAEIKIINDINSLCRVITCTPFGYH